MRKNDVIKNQGEGEVPVPPIVFHRVLLFYVLTVFDLIHGKADTDGIAFIVKTDLADRGIDVVGLQGFAESIVFG